MQLFEKYDTPVPRYTSYPSIPFWKGLENKEVWLKTITTKMDDLKNGFAIYIHLPFCESLCTFCGCTKVISKSHEVEKRYINALIKEWEMYKQVNPKGVRLKQLHLGGGTPTFFSCENLKLLLNRIFSDCSLTEETELSFEAHPNTTTPEHLKTLAQLGFRRVSFGIQDFDPLVQRTINRIQTYERVEDVVTLARRFGFESINFDLIYGLPKQSNASVVNTIGLVKKLMPERIAFYGYAHVPQLKPSQRKFSEEDIPSGAKKRSLYETGRDMLLASGYCEIGMDHFALPNDSLSLAAVQKTLHRNFMGYTTQSSDVLIGLGMSAISDAWSVYAQNAKNLEEYYFYLEQGFLPIIHGHQLKGEEELTRRTILELMCYFRCLIDEAGLSEVQKKRLQELVDDGLVSIEGQNLIVRERGVPFLRNICAVVDSCFL